MVLECELQTNMCTTHRHHRHYHRRRHDHHRKSPHMLIQIFIFAERATYERGYFSYTAVTQMCMYMCIQATNQLTN